MSVHVESSHVDVRKNVKKGVVDIGDIWDSKDGFVVKLKLPMKLGFKHYFPI